MSKINTNAIIVFIVAVLVFGLVLNYVVKKTLKTKAGNNALYIFKKNPKDRIGGKLKKKKKKFTSK